MTDLYTKAVLTVIASALLVLAGRSFLEPAPASGGAFSEGKTPTDVAKLAAPDIREVPKAWGRLAGVSWSGGLTTLYFEGADGTIRPVKGLRLCCNDMLVRK
jgi:hypothetical protein